MRKIYLCFYMIALALVAATGAHAQYYITNATQSVDTGCMGLVRASITTNTYTLGQQIETSWGNASVTTVNTYNQSGQGHASAQTTYLLAGTYTIKHVLINASLRVDSVIQSFTYNGCQKVNISSYNDLNSNCVYDLGDIPNYFPLTIKIDSNNVVIDTINTTGFHFIHFGPPGTIYRYTVIATPPGLTVTCPISGIILDTVTGPNQVTNKSYAVNCAPVPAYDLAANATVYVKPDFASMHINLTNTDCNGANATLVANLSPKTPFGWSYPAPTSVVGNTVTWNINVAALNPQYITIHVDTPFLTPLTIGDTVQTSFYLTPTAGDTDVSNNTIIRVDTVKAAFDPNFKDVVPQGAIAAGTELKYTIHFENTGNDTAHNIYLLDTLSDKLDPTSFNLITTTDEVYTEVVKYANSQYLIKFDFPNIMLPDSSHHGLCDGMVVFTLKARSNLLPGTVIPNRAGIYFDTNPVVMTNSVVNYIPIPQNVSAVNGDKNISLYPNPVNDVLTIVSEKNAFNTLEVANIIGQVMVKQSITQTETKVNVKGLPSGIYTVTLTGNSGKKTIKFEKL